MKATVNLLCSKFGLLLAFLLTASLLLAACGDGTTATTASTTAAATATTAAINTAPPQAASTVGATTVASASIKRGGVVRVGLSQEPDTLNPLLSAQTVSSLISGLIIEGLVDVSPEGQYVPRLVETVPTQANGGVTADGLAVTYKLKKGVKWSDGKPFTAKDVVFTYKVIMDDANAIPT